jgi:hypothetical protein
MDAFMGLVATGTIGVLIVQNEGGYENEIRLARWIERALSASGVQDIELVEPTMGFESIDLPAGRTMIVHGLGTVDRKTKADVDMMALTVTSQREGRRLIIVRTSTTFAPSTVDRAAYVRLDETSRIDAALVKLMREASGMGMSQCHAIAREASERLSSDFVLALLAADAHGLAVNIRSRCSLTTDQEARRRWDLQHAASQRPERVRSSDAWARLDRLSGLHPVR